MVKVENYAHRGGAGLAPENSLAACQIALAIGVDVIDMDIHLTKDNIVVAYHDSRLSAAITRDLQKKWLAQTEVLLIKNLDYLQLSQFDIGRLNPNHQYAARYPLQRGMDDIKISPIRDIIRYIKHVSSSVRLEVELKTKPPEPHLSPNRESFVRALLADVMAEDFLTRMEFQSFDWQTLILLKQYEPQAKLSFVTQESTLFNSLHCAELPEHSWTGSYQIANYNSSVPAMIAAAGGQVWNPYYRDLSEQRVAEAHAHDLRVVPWTVDKGKDMLRLLDMNVDGILSNRPDILRGILAARHIPVARPVDYD